MRTSIVHECRRSSTCCHTRRPKSAVFWGCRVGRMEWGACAPLRLRKNDFLFCRCFDALGDEFEGAKRCATGLARALLRR